MKICRYCGGVIRLVPASSIYGESAERLGMKEEWLYQCQNCNARVGCHKGTRRPLGNVANEVLRLKRMETHQVFDSFWRAKRMSRTKAYRWLSEQMELPESKAHLSAALRWNSASSSLSFAGRKKRKGAVHDNLCHSVLRC